MMRINLAEDGTRLPDLIDAALNGETVIISKDGHDIVQLTPVTSP